MNITIVSSTNRAESMSLKISLFVKKIYEVLGATVQIIDLQEFPASCFTPQVYKEKPPELTPFIDAILNADGVLFVIPEYNGSFPGMLKYYIDMWKFPDCYIGLKTAYVGISGGQWGALRAVEHFQGVMGYRNATQYPDRIFINKIGARWNGNGFSPLQKTDQDIEQKLVMQAQGFLSFCAKD
jgi:chromate reductase